MKPIKRRALLLTAVPLTAVLAGGIALAATSGNSPASPTGSTSTPQERDRARDGSCLNSPTATPNTTAGALQNRDQIRDRARDGSCLGSPTALPGAPLQHMYEHRYQHADDAADR